MRSLSMPAPYSIDLRRRVINAYEAKEGSQREIAQRFQVSHSFVKRLIERYRETGTIEPKSQVVGSDGYNQKIRTQAG